MAKPRRAIAPSVYRDGPGVHVISSRQPWYRPGYRGICGTKEVVPVAVRSWDPHPFLERLEAQFLQTVLPTWKKTRIRAARMAG
jgi:hypothetical protein